MERTRKLAVLSAGGIGLTLILERSGLGDASYLPTVGVQDIVSDLLSVDSDLQDHQISLFV